MQKYFSLFSLCALALLSACGGGGGGGSSATASGASVAVVSKIVNGEQVNASGELSFANNNAASGVALGANLERFDVSVASPIVADALSYELDEITDANGNTQSLVWKNNGNAITGQVRITYGANGVSVSGVGFTSHGEYTLISNKLEGIIAVATSDLNGVLLEVDNENPALNFNFQSFGIWAKKNNATNYTGGVYSYGSTLTPVIPTTGTATFNGLAGGSYGKKDADTGGLVYSKLVASVDFVNRSVALDASNSHFLDLSNGNKNFAWSPNSKFDFTGNLTYQANSNSFTGSLTNTGGLGTGTATGRFYGDQAQELGGVFKFENANEIYGGAFGAKKQ